MYVAREPWPGARSCRGLTFLTLGTRPEPSTIAHHCVTGVVFSGLLRLLVSYLMTLGISASQPVSTFVEDDSRASSPPYLSGI